jgi:hypothetical protein
MRMSRMSRRAAGAGFIGGGLVLTLAALACPARLGMETR